MTDAERDAKRIEVFGSIKAADEATMHIEVLMKVLESLVGGVPSGREQAVFGTIWYMLTDPKAKHADLEEMLALARKQADYYSTVGDDE